MVTAEAGSRIVSVAVWPRVRMVLATAALLALALSLFLPPLYVVLGLLTLTALAVALRRPVLGLSLLALSVPWGSGFPVTFGSFPVTSTDELVAAVGAAWLASAISSRRSPLAPTSLFYISVLFLLAISVSATQASDIHASEREVLKWLEFLVVYLAAVYFIRSRAELAILIAAILLGGLSQALLGYVQSGFSLGPVAFTHGLLLRAYGTFDQPNPYAGYLNMVLPFSLALAVATPRPRLRLWSGLCCLLILGAIVASQSRGALLASVLAVAVVVACAWPRLRGPMFALVVAGILGAWLASLGLVPLGPFARVLDAVGLGGVSFGNVNDANFSAVERAAHWLAGVRMFAAHPLLGVGIGNYADAYPAYHPRGWYAPLAHAHDYYINIAAEAGILGLASYLLLIGSALWYSYAAIRAVQDWFYKAALWGVLGALVATSFHNLFDVLYVHGMVALLGLLLAVVTASLALPSRMTQASNQSS